jgi:AcrR family transcriptional regulator
MPISDCEVRDPRIRRTRQLLQSALRTLMQSKSFEEISVQDITETATVNRATFYDHYADKFALLDALIAGGFHMLVHERNLHFETSCPSAANTIILAVCDYFGLIHQNCMKRGPFDPLVDAAIIGAIRRVLTRGLRTADSTSSLRAEMAATGASCAIYGAVKEWFYTPDRPSAAEIVPQIQVLVLPMLQSLEEPHILSPAIA